MTVFTSLPHFYAVAFHAAFVFLFRIQEVNIVVWKKEKKRNERKIEIQIFIGQFNDCFSKKFDQSMYDVLPRN